MGNFVPRWWVLLRSCSISSISEIIVFMRRRHGREAIQHRKVLGVSCLFSHSLVLSLVLVRGHGHGHGHGENNRILRQMTAMLTSIPGQMGRLASFVSLSPSGLVTISGETKKRLLHYNSDTVRRTSTPEKRSCYAMTEGRINT